MSLLCDLYSAAENKSNVSFSLETDKWCSMEYSTKLGRGNLLLTSYNGNPKPVTLNINLSG